MKNELHIWLELYESDLQIYVLTNTSPSCPVGFYLADYQEHGGRPGKS